MSSRFDALDAYIEAIMPTWHCPSVAVAVVREDEIVHLAGYGLRDVEQALPTSPDTRYAAASMTKAFTAMGVALLVEEGLVEWDKPVRDYVPHFKLKDSYASANITLRDMLCHRSGLPRHDMAWYGSAFSREELVKMVQYHEPNKTFRAGWEYNNMMYVTAGYITGVMAGMSWEQFIQTRIFDPLGMSSASFTPDDPRPTPNTALPYRVHHRAGEDDRLEGMPYYRDSGAMAPAGAIYASLNDMVRWLKVHLNGGRSGDVQLVSAGTLAEMHRPAMIMPVNGMTEALLGTTLRAYGLGWFVEPYRGYDLLHHGGNIDGFSVLISFIPQAKVGAVVLTNIEGRPVRDLLTYELYDRLLDLPDGEWNARYHGIWEGVIAGIDGQRETAAAERLTTTTPSHPLPDYAGEYAADGYQDVVVKCEDNALYSWFIGQWWPLEHYHYDIFELHVEAMDMHVKLAFSSDTRGDISSVAVPIEPAVPAVVYTRKPLHMSHDELAALVGVYNLPIEGLDLTLSLKPDGHLYARATGQAETQLVPYRSHADALEFRLKADANTTVEVRREEGGLVAYLKQLGMTLRGPRRNV